MITQQQVDEAKSLLLMIVNQAMARGLFNSIEDMPKVLDAVNLTQKIFNESRAANINAGDVELLVKVIEGLTAIKTTIEEAFDKE